MDTTTRSIPSIDNKDPPDRDSNQSSCTSQPMPIPIIQSNKDDQSSRRSDLTSTSSSVSQSVPLPIIPSINDDQSTGRRVVASAASIDACANPAGDDAPPEAAFFVTLPASPSVSPSIDNDDDDEHVNDSMILSSAVSHPVLPSNANSSHLTLLHTGSIMHTSTSSCPVNNLTGDGDKSARTASVTASVMISTTSVLHPVVSSIVGDASSEREALPRSGSIMAPSSSSRTIRLPLKGDDAKPARTETADALAMPSSSFRPSIHPLNGNDDKSARTASSIAGTTVSRPINLPLNGKKDKPASSTASTTARVVVSRPVVPVVKPKEEEDDAKSLCSASVAVGSSRGSITSLTSSPGVVKSSKNDDDVEFGSNANSPLSNSGDKNEMKKVKVKEERARSDRTTSRASEETAESPLSYSGDKEEMKKVEVKEERAQFNRSAAKAPEESGASSTSGPREKSKRSHTVPKRFLDGYDPGNEPTQQSGKKEKEEQSAAASSSSSSDSRAGVRRDIKPPSRFEDYATDSEFEPAVKKERKSGGGNEKKNEKEKGSSNTPIQPDAASSSSLHRSDVRREIKRPPRFESDWEDEDYEPLVKREKKRTGSNEKRMEKEKRPSGNPVVKNANRPPAVRSHTPKVARETSQVKIIERLYDLRRAPKNLVDKKIDKEVAKAEKETLAALQARVHREMEAGAGGKDNPWIEDYVITAVKGKLTKLIVKFSGYGIPSLVDVSSTHGFKTPEYADFYTRHLVLQRLVKVLRLEMGDDFARFYPNRFGKMEKGYGESKFIQDPVNLAKNQLRAAEWRVSFEAEKHHQPAVIFENWTADINQLPNFQYSPFLRPTRKVRRALRKLKEYEGVRCNKKSCREDSSCSTMIGGMKKDRVCNCCIKGSVKGEFFPMECNAACACNPEICGNQVVQTGRQKSLLVFFHHMKGWTLRALSDYSKHEFIGEMVGEVVTKWEETMRARNNYSMEMAERRVKVTDKVDEKGKPIKEEYRHLVIDSGKYGNELRFVAHSCSANCTVLPVYVERAGRFYCRMAIIANRPITFGEELSIDYFPNMSPRTSNVNTNDLFDECYCGTGVRCKFRGPLTEAARKEREETTSEEFYEQRRREAEEEGDSWSEGDSDDEDEVEEDEREKEEDEEDMEHSEYAEEEHESRITESEDEEEKEERDHSDVEDEEEDRKEKESEEDEEQSEVDDEKEEEEEESDEHSTNHSMEEDEKDTDDSEASDPTTRRAAEPAVRAASVAVAASMNSPVIPNHDAEIIWF